MYFYIIKLYPRLENNSQTINVRLSVKKVFGVGVRNN